MKQQYLLISLLSITFTAKAQYPLPGLYKVRIADTDRNVVAEINQIEGTVKVQTNSIYYWVSAGHIHSTQGAYSGTLLNGAYTEFYLNKNLRLQGQYREGLKIGIWKAWNSTGTLTNTETWNKGIKQGVFYIYDEKGQVKQSGTYNNGQLNGQLINYKDGKAIASQYYKKGILQASKTKANPESKSKSHIKSKTTFWKRLNIFSKKDTTAASKTQQATPSSQAQIKPSPKPINNHQ